MRTAEFAWYGDGKSSF